MNDCQLFMRHAHNGVILGSSPSGPTKFSTFTKQSLLISLINYEFECEYF